MQIICYYSLPVLCSLPFLPEPQPWRPVGHCPPHWARWYGSFAYVPLTDQMVLPVSPLFQKSTEICPAKPSMISVHPHTNRYFACLSVCLFSLLDSWEQCLCLSFLSSKHFAECLEPCTCSVCAPGINKIMVENILYTWYWWTQWDTWHDWNAEKLRGFPKVTWWMSGRAGGRPSLLIPYRCAFGEQVKYQGPWGMIYNNSLNFFCGNKAFCKTRELRRLKSCCLSGQWVAWPVRITTCALRSFHLYCAGKFSPSLPDGTEITW